jgi:hypothetical protein
MESLTSFFNKVTAYTAGFYGAVAGCDAGKHVAVTIIDVTGLGQGLLPGAVAVAFLAAGLYIGARVGYRGAYSLLADGEPQRLSATRTLRPA